MYNFVQINRYFLPKNPKKICFIVFYCQKKIIVISFEYKDLIMRLQQFLFLLS